MPSLRQVQTRTATVDIYSRDIDKGGLVIHRGMDDVRLLVEYKVVSGTVLDDEAALAKAAQAAEASEDGADEVNKLYADLITKTVVKWDLSVEDGGDPIPLDNEAIRAQVPTDILRDVIAGIANHKRPPNLKRSPGR